MAKNKYKISSAKTIKTFLSGRVCSTTLFHVINRAFNNPMEYEEYALEPFAGGIKQHGHQCGMIWGAVLAAGARSYELYGAGTEAEARAIFAAQTLVQTFDKRYNNINCYEITQLNKSSSNLQMVTYFLLKGGSIGCLRMSAGYSKAAFSKLNDALAEENITVPTSLVSCASVLAKKIGASDQHATMVAGLAGGIGLCGEACGALGAAIWLVGMKFSKDNEVKSLWGDKEFSEKFEKMMNSFLKASDYEFECSAITGKKFENASEHSSWLKEGGCSKILDALASV